MVSQNPSGSSPYREVQTAVANKYPFNSLSPSSHSPFTLKGLVSNLISSIDIDEALKSSFKNYHVEGMDYFNLQRRDGLTIRCYSMPANKITLNSDKLLLAPHNHRYNFDTFVLEGEVVNVTFVPCASNVEGCKTWRRYPFDPEKKKFTSDYDKNQSLIARMERYGEGDSFHITTDEIHSLVHDVTMPLTLVSFQYADRAIPTYGYSINGAPTVAPGFYKPFSKAELNEKLIELYNLCNR